jgi:hypothetical protein
MAKARRIASPHKSAEIIKRLVLTYFDGIRRKVVPCAVFI